MKYAQEPSWGELERLRLRKNEAFWKTPKREQDAFKVNISAWCWVGVRVWRQPPATQQPTLASLLCICLPGQAECFSVEEGRKANQEETWKAQAWEKGHQRALFRFSGLDTLVQFLQRHESLRGSTWGSRDVGGKVSYPEPVTHLHFENGRVLYVANDWCTFTKGSKVGNEHLSHRTKGV